jgi:hypothetical protein
MVTLYWRGFPAIVNWLVRGEAPLDGCTCESVQGRGSDPGLETVVKREARQDEEAAAFTTAATRWGNFR